MPVTIGGLLAGAAELFGAVAPEAAIAGEAAVGAGAAAEAGAIALPEIAVTAAAPEIAAGVGTEAALGGGLLAGEAGLAGAELAGGAGAGAAALGLTGGIGDLTGGALTGAAPIATEGVTAVAPSVAPALGGAAAGGVPSDVLSGTTGPLSALDTGGGPSTFDQLWQSDVSQLPAGGSVDISSQVGGGPQSFAATTEPQFGPFANAPAAVPGQADLGTAELAAGTSPTDPSLAGLNLPPGVADAISGGTPGVGDAGLMTPTAQGLSGTPVIPASYTPPGGVAGAGGAASDVSAIAGSTVSNATPAGTSLTTAGGGAPSGGLSSLLSGSNLRTAALLAPVGALGLTLARGQPSVPPAEELALANAQTVGNFGTQQLQMARKNQITPAQAQQIDTYVQNSTNQLYQFYARMGRDPNNDSDYLQGVQQINQNAVAMRQQFIDAMITNGLAATGQVDQTLQAAANQQVASDAAFTQALTSSLSSFGLVAALSAGTRAA